MNKEHRCLFGIVVLTVLFTITAILAALMMSKTLLVVSIGLGLTCWVSVCVLFVVFILNNANGINY